MLEPPDYDDTEPDDICYECGEHYNECECPLTIDEELTEKIQP